MQSKAEEAFFVLQELNYIFSLPLALKAAMDLRIPDILAAAGTPLTPEQIADNLPRKSHDAAAKVGRILQLLAHKGVFAETITPAGEPRSYGLTDTSRYLVTGSEFELRPYLAMMQRPDMHNPREPSPGDCRGGRGWVRTCERERDLDLREY